MMKSLTYYMKLKDVKNREQKDFILFSFQAFQYLCNKVEKQTLTSILRSSQFNTG